MAETLRPRPVEYQSPRPLILGICFIWGIGVGFALNFFRPDENFNQPETPVAVPTQQIPEQTGPSELERRRLDAPAITEVAPLQEPTVNLKPTLEDMELSAPSTILTTEGELTGRTAAVPGTARAQVAPAPAAGAPGYGQTQSRAPTPPAPPPPPLPDLMP